MVHEMRGMKVGWECLQKRKVSTRAAEDNTEEGKERKKAKPLKATKAQQAKKPKVVLIVAVVFDSCGFQQLGINHGSLSEKSDFLVHPVKAPYYLFKSEPSAYSINALESEKDSTAEWDGKKYMNV